MLLVPQTLAGEQFQKVPPPVDAPSLRDNSVTGNTLFLEYSNILFV
ncbi:hypothetical protein FLA_4131 [Filimonas lacunae]|nr:hypothetical protein FLA_4131 [Filimonas lacunae]